MSEISLNKHVTGSNICDECVLLYTCQTFSCKNVIYMGLKGVTSGDLKQLKTGDVVIYILRLISSVHYICEVDFYLGVKYPRNGPLFGKTG